MTLTVRSSSVTGATTAGRELTYAEMDANWAHVIQASNQNFTPSGTGGITEPVSTSLNRLVFASWYGVTGDGVTDDTTAFNNARTRARAIKARLVITGTPLISSALTISTKEHWVFDGAYGNSTGARPDSYLIKKSTVAADLVTITAADTIIEGGGIVGQNGNTGDGYSIQTNGVSLFHPYVEGCGNDGIRVGKATGVNANSFLLYRPTSSANGRYGINLDDLPGGASNANVGTVLQPLVQNNGSHGIYVNGAFSNSIINPLCESNTGYGLYLDTYSKTKVYGGDCEANTAGDLFQADTNNNEIHSLSVASNDYSSFYQVGTIAPGETGTNILQNPSFSADTNWTKSGGATISGGLLHLPANSQAYQAFKTVIGHSYTVRATITASSPQNMIWIGTTAVNHDLVFDGYINTTGTFEASFVATTQITYVTLFNDVSGTTSTWSLASIKGNVASGGAVTSNHATLGIGYATGAGGAVTQGTSRTTGVTLNNVTGTITLVSAAGTASWQSFTVTNSTVAATDTVRVVQKSGTDKYQIHVTNVAAGSFEITYATTGGTTTEQPAFNFTVIKGVSA